MSKYRIRKSDICYPDTSVPVNKLNIQDADTLHALEEELLTEAYSVFISELNEKTRFDENYFKSLHARTFDSLYEWAGQYRTFDMYKAESMFCRGAYVAQESRRIFSQFDRINDFHKKWNKEEFAEYLGRFKCERIALHPFYESNGRIIRLFFDIVALAHGFDLIDYRHHSPEEYLEASIECVQYADPSKMTRILFDGLKKL